MRLEERLKEIETFINNTSSGEFYQYSNCLNTIEMLQLQFEIRKKVGLLVQDLTEIVELLKKLM